jgi:hypothetical protein
VATLGLEGATANRVKLLITFGSGLRKLEELAELQRSLSFRRGAALTVTGLVFVAITTAALPNVIELVRRSIAQPSDLWVWAGYGVVGLSLLIAGIGDFVSGPEPPRLRELGRNLGSRGLQWRDLYASADPVSNGALHEDATLPPQSIQVVNLGSMLSDHTSYWRNRDEFVSLVSDALLEYDDPPVLPRLEPETIAYLRKRRGLRVMMLRFSGWVCVGSVFALIIRYSKEWGATLTWLATWIAEKVAAPFGGKLARLSAPGADTWARSAGWLAFILLAGLIARRVWLAWDRLETEKPPPYRYTGSKDTVFGVALGFQLVVIGIAWSHGELPGWLIPVALLVSCALAAIPAFGAKPAELKSVGVARTPRRTKAEVVGSVLYTLFLLGTLLIAGPLGFVALVRWTRNLLARALDLEEPSWLLVAIILVVGWIALSFLVAGIVHLAIRRRRRTSSIPPCT